jgi:glutathione synthase/RimK-type ligase-like ATP-grasp enzyme
MDEAFIVIDPVPAVINDKGLSFKISTRGKVDCIYDGHALNNVVSVWDRRPTRISQGLLKTVDPEYLDYSLTSIREHTRQLYLQLSDSLWVSDYFAIQRAEGKSLQLREAAKVGFSIPETIFTSDIKFAKQFVSRHPATIIKGMNNKWPMIDKTSLIFFSTRVTPKTKLRYQNLNLAPSIFQQAINAAHDLRITVIGDKVFAAKIIADAEEGLAIGIRDWRIGQYEGTLTVEAYDLPARVTEQCKRLVSDLGLRFGAIDMIVDTHGKFWFLEINPNGQWAFIEEMTKQPIGKAMARMLMTGRSSM